MNVYEYYDSNNRSFTIGMNSYARRVFLFCRRNEIYDPLKKLFEKLKEKGISERFELDRRVSDGMAPDFVFEYTPSPRKYKFVYSMGDKKRVSVIISTDTLFFDRVNDLANLGDLPEDLINLLNKKSRQEGSAIYHLECEDEVDDDYSVDYTWSL